MRWSEEVSVPTKNTNVKLHKVVLLDCSGSMQGDKYDAAEQGVRLDYEGCKKEFTDYLLVEFSNYNWRKLYDFTTGLVFSPSFGGTALYDTIEVVFNDLLTSIPKEDKVLVQIFTDGMDMHSKPGARQRAKSLIEQFNAKGWTVTFVGTDHDVQYIQSNLSIDSTNTLVHDNTASGVANSFETYRGATSLYTKAVKKGEEVTRGFFKSIKQ